MPAINEQCPIVARCEGRWAHERAKYEMHRLRAQSEDNNHIDPGRRHLDTVPIGNDDWLQTTKARIELMRDENFAEKHAAQKAQSRLKDMQATSRGGPQGPWAKSEGGPLRESILTAHHQCIEGANTAEEAKKMTEDRARDLARAGRAGSIGREGNRRSQELNAREAAFEELAVARLKDRFGATVSSVTPPPAPPGGGQTGTGGAALSGPRRHLKPNSNALALKSADGLRPGAPGRGADRNRGRGAVGAETSPETEQQRSRSENGGWFTPRPPREGGRQEQGARRCRG